MMCRRIDAAECEGTFNRDGLYVLRVGTPGANEIPVSHHIAAEDGGASGWEPGGHADKDDEPVPFTDTAVEAEMVPCISVVRECLHSARNVSEGRCRTKSNNAPRP